MPLDSSCPQSYLASSFYSHTNTRSIDSSTYNRTNATSNRIQSIKHLVNAAI